MDYMTAEDLYNWAKERNLEKLPILTYDNYGELCHYISSDLIDVSETDDLVIQKGNQMTKLLGSLIEMPTYLSIALAIFLSSMILSLLMILARSRAKFKVGRTLKIIYVSSIAILLIGLFYNNQQVKKAKESVSISRNHDIVKISSNSQFLKSAEFRVSAENDHYVYLENEDSIFKIDKDRLKELDK